MYTIYNDSKTHSKMDINYRGFSSPHPCPRAPDNHRPVTVNRCRRTDLEDLLSILMYEPNLSNRKAVYFNPHKIKKNTRPYAKYFTYICIYTRATTSSVLFLFFFIIYFLFLFFRQCKTVGNTKNVIWN